jgi:hypothetical protein
MDDKAKVTELQINVVMLDRRKMLIRLNQKVCGLDGCLFLIRRERCSTGGICSA